MSKIENPIDVYMIWAAETADLEVIWLVESWDEWQIDGNYDGWLEAIAKAEKENEAIRITKTTVDYSKVQAMFQPEQIDNSGITHVTKESI